MPTVSDALARLSTSKFRSSFHLSRKDRAYLEEKGPDVIRSHAQDFVRLKLAPAEPVNDGKQTPMDGHPVFVAQHATATCCRNCLNKWWKVPLGRQLTMRQMDKIVNLIMAWIAREMAP